MRARRTAPRRPPPEIPIISPAKTVIATRSTMPQSAAPSRITAGSKSERRDERHKRVLEQGHAVVVETLHHERQKITVMARPVAGTLYAS